MTANATLERTTFATSRLLEFFSEKELSMQIGFVRESWPHALAKELIDNALDAAEAAGVTPIIEVELAEDALTVRDNGPGIPAETVVRSLDYQVRVSDKNHYVAPTRGQLGNALKCVYAAAFLATEEEGHVEIEAQGLNHDIRVTLDRIAQEPAISYSVTETPDVRTGTSVTLHWPGIALLTRRRRNPRKLHSLTRALVRGLQPPRNLPLRRRGDRRHHDRLAQAPPRGSNQPALVHGRHPARSHRRVCGRGEVRW